jgi:uncharacterized repeat protein (TIGR01451 family)
VDLGDDGSEVTAIADAGYHFVQWSDGSTTNPRIDANVTADITVSASFAIDQFTLTYTADTNGSITGTTPQTVDYGSDGTAVTAVADTGYHFVQWSDAVEDNPRTDTNVTADITVSASFAINRYTVTATSSANGSITPASQMIDHGDTASFVVTPDAGYSVAVSGDTCALSLSAGTTWTSTAIEADCQVTATFTFIPVPVLEINVDDSQNFARYGSLLNYIVTVTNTGTADAVNVSLSNTVPAQLDAAFTTWTCIGAGSGASCPASGSGNLNTTGISLPAGRTLIWLVTAPVQSQAIGDTVEYGVEARLSTNETVSDNDIDTLVIYRGGFDAPHEDGGNVVEPVLNACSLDTPFATFDDASVWTFLPLATTATLPIQVIATALDSSGMGIRIEQLNMEQTPRIRIVSIAGEGSQRASAWVDVNASTMLALATIDSAQGGRAMMLVGANEPLEIKLPTGIAGTLQIRASSFVNTHCQ